MLDPHPSSWHLLATDKYCRYLSQPRHPLHYVHHHLALRSLLVDLVALVGGPQGLKCLLNNNSKVTVY